MPKLSAMPTAQKPLAQMPALPTQAARAAAATPKKVASNGTVAAVEQEEKKRPVIYPERKAEVCDGANALTERDIDIILDWCPEKEYQKRMMALAPGTEAAAWSYDDTYMLKDVEGNKVKCMNNLDNRPFDEKWCRGLAQTILNFQWAGGITITDLATYVYGAPGMAAWTAPDGRVYNVGDLIEMSAGTINGSSISVSLTGRVESGQHSGCALKLACQMYRAAPKGTYPKWDEYLAQHAGRHNFGTYPPGPVLETILVTGLSEDRRVLMTVDNCKPRTTMDVLYTSKIFQKYREQPARRQELSRMLSACGDLFWKRTLRQGYKTHAEFMAMVEDHPRLIKCVEHLFACNADAKSANGKVGKGGYVISNLGLSAGQSACLMYLMGSSASDGDEYRNGKPAPRERGLDWSRWEQAEEFWSSLGASEGFEPVRRALLTKVVGDVEVDGTLAYRSRMTILARAWAVYVAEGRQFTALDLEEGGCLHLRYEPASETMVGDEVRMLPADLLEDPYDFGGVDVPDKAEVDGERPKTAEEIEAAKQEQLRMRTA